MAAEAARLVAIWCPHWPMVASGVSPLIPAATLRANRVTSCTPAARPLGVKVGQRRREAQRTCPDLLLVDNDPTRDSLAFEPVARAVARFTPQLEVLDAGWAYLKAKGPARYFGGEVAFVGQLQAAVAQAAGEVGPAAQVRVAVADGRFAGTVAAQLAADTPMVVPAGASPEFLAPLPIAWLHHTNEATPEMVDLFSRLGLTTLGALAGLERADVLARFGESGVHLHRLASGQDPRSINAAAPADALGMEASFDDPITLLEPLVFRAKTMADDLARLLDGNGLTCTRLLVSAQSDHGEQDQRGWYRAAGMSAPDMVERVRWQLAGWLASGELSAGVVHLRLEPDEVRANSGEQVALWGGTSMADDRAMRAVARLTSLVGDHSVLVPEWRGGRLPSERVRWITAAAVELTHPTHVNQRLGPLVKASGSAPPAAPWPGALPLPSPSVVLDAPEPAVLADQDGHPLRVNGRGELSGQPMTLAVADRVPRLVLDWAGPWVIDERWWDVTGRRRVARLQVLCDDGAAHLVAAEHQRWWLLAAYR